MTFIQLVQALKAESGDRNLRGRRVKPVDLDVYNEPDFASEEQPTVSELKPPHLILMYVSAVRKKVWKFKDVTINTYGKADGAVTGLKQGVVDVYEKAKSDPLTMLRPGCIAFACLAGAIVHGRGRKPVLRFTTATVAGTLVAAVAYPDKALEASKQIYHNSKEASISLVNLAKKWMEQTRTVEVKEVSGNENPGAGSSSMNDSLNAGLNMEMQDKGENDFVVLNANGEEVCPIDTVEVDLDTRVKLFDPNEIPESEREAGNKIEQEILKVQEGNDAISLEDHKQDESLVDYGQSNPEDNDMYSTRS